MTVRLLRPIWVVRVVSSIVKPPLFELQFVLQICNFKTTDVLIGFSLSLSLSLNQPPAARCAWEDGFIMSDLRHTERGFRWSSCSTEQFKHFLNGETSTCLYNYPHENQLLPRVLPGTMLTLDEQCKRDRGTNACFVSAASNLWSNLSGPTNLRTASKKILCRTNCFLF